MENPLMFDKRFVNLEEVKSLLRQKERIEKMLLQAPQNHCHVCGDTKPIHQYSTILGMAVGEGIYQTSPYICNRCALSDEQYEEIFGAPKEVVPDFVEKDADSNCCEFHDEAQGRHFCYNKRQNSVTCQGICKHYKDKRL